MRVGTTSRRAFLAAAGATAFTAPLLRAQSTSHFDFGAAERDRVIADANTAATGCPRTIAGLAAPPKDLAAHTFYSDGDPIAGTGFRAHGLALCDASANIAALTAGYVLSKQDRYALAAGRHLWAWFVAPESRLRPTFASAGCPAGSTTGSPAGLIDAAALAEIARSIPFLIDSPALSPPDLVATKSWFSDLLQWMTTDRTALLARDAKDHVASSWLVVASSIARLVNDSATFDDCRRRFKKPTLRNQVNANGEFHHEAQSPYPYRNSLFNFDLLGAAAEVLTTPFSTPWTDELEDGPSLRSVSAFLYPYLKDQARWPFLADADHYRETPRRRPALLFAGRAFSRPEYIELWRSLPPLRANDPLRATFPIRQPLLWITRAPHGA